MVRMKERLFFFAFCFFLACEYHSDILPGGRLGLGDICGVASFGLADRDGVGDERCDELWRLCCYAMCGQLCRQHAAVVCYERETGQTNRWADARLFKMIPKRSVVGGGERGLMAAAGDKIGEQGWELELRLGSWSC